MWASSPAGKTIQRQSACVCVKVESPLVRSHTGKKIPPTKPHRPPPAHTRLAEFSQAARGAAAEVEAGSVKLMSSAEVIPRAAR